jgi:hypothetical protein
MTEADEAWTWKDGSTTLAFLTVTTNNVAGAAVRVLDAAFSELEGLQGEVIPDARGSGPDALVAALSAVRRVRQANMTFTIVAGTPSPITLVSNGPITTAAMTVWITVHALAAARPGGSNGSRPREATAAEVSRLIGQIWARHRPGGEFGRQLEWLASLAERADVGSEVVTAAGSGRSAGVRFDLVSGGTVTVYPPRNDVFSILVMLEGEGVTDGVALELFRAICPV